VPGIGGTLSGLRSSSSSERETLVSSSENYLRALGVCVSTFVTDFKAYAQTRTDAPVEFHVHAAMAALSYALGNNVWMPDRSDLLYPNIWTVIIGRSGAGKSVPLNLTKRLLTKAGIFNGKLSSSFSWQGTVQSLADADHKTRSMWIENEFSSFMGQIHADYNSGFMQMLTDLFDVPEQWSRKLSKSSWKSSNTSDDDTGDKSFTLNRPAITILGASTPDWLSDCFKSNALRGGFLARFLFCPSDNYGEYVGHPGDFAHDIEEGLAYHLKQVAALKGCFDVSQVQAQHDEWDQLQRAKLKRGEVNPDFAGMRSRGGMMAWKAAMIMHVSRDPFTLTLTKNDMDRAIRYVQHTHDLAEEYLTDKVATDKQEAQRLKILEVLRGMGGRGKWNEVLKHSRIHGPQFKQALDTLLDSELVYTEDPPRGTGGRGYICLPGYAPGISMNGHSNGHIDLGDEELVEIVPDSYKESEPDTLL